MVNAAENCSNAVKRTTTSQPAPEPPSFTGNLKQQQKKLPDTMNNLEKYLHTLPLLALIKQMKKENKY